MKLSTRARYAVMAMANLADTYSQGRGAVPLSEIAKMQGLSLSYLEQLFHKLKVVGLVNSVRGINGGFLLARKPSEISVYDIIQTVDKAIEVVRCSANSAKGCQEKGVRCMTHNLWDSLGFIIRNFLSRTTLADVIENKNLITHVDSYA